MIVPKFTIASGFWVLLAAIGGMQVALNGVGWLAPMFIGAALSFLAAWFWFRMNANAAERKRLVEINDKRAERIAQGHDELVARVEANTLMLASMQASVQPISEAYKAMLIKGLTHFHTPEMDALMVKLGPPSTITPEEMARLMVLLKERETVVDAEISDSERDAAHILPVIIKRCIEEQSSAVSDTKLVTVPVPEAMSESRLKKEGP